MLDHFTNAVLCAVAAGALIFGGTDAPIGTATRHKSLPRAEMEMLSRTLLGECGRCGDAEIKAIGHVVLNRLRSGRYGQEIADVVTYKRRGVYAFTGWDPRHNKLEAVGRHVDRSKAFIRAWGLAETVWQEERDPTGGAVDFYHPAGMKPVGRVPKWAQHRKGVRIGGAVFFR